MFSRPLHEICLALPCFTAGLAWGLALWAFGVPAGHLLELIFFLVRDRLRVAHSSSEGESAFIRKAVTNWNTLAACHSCVLGLWPTPGLLGPVRMT